jgi:transposase
MHVPELPVRGRPRRGWAVNRLKNWRDLATRYAKRASIYRACLVLIAAIIWLK